MPATNGAQALNIDDELKIVRTIVSALYPLDGPTRGRVLEYVRGALEAPRPRSARASSAPARSAARPLDDHPGHTAAGGQAAPGGQANPHHGGPAPGGQADDPGRRADDERGGAADGARGPAAHAPRPPADHDPAAGEAHDGRPP